MSRPSPNGDRPQDPINGTPHPNPPPSKPITPPDREGDR